MKLILPYFILLIVVVQLLLRKNTKKEDDANRKFWERESLANSTRKKDISSLNYITVPDTLPFDNIKDFSQNNLGKDDIFKINSAINTIITLKDKKILNLSSFSNTDLKLEYGVANFTQLSEYDNNFTQLIKSLNTIGTTILAVNDNSDAADILEYAINIGSDLSTTYTALARHYIAVNDTAAINKLVKQAESINSLMKNTILNELNALSAN